MRYRLLSQKAQRQLHIIKIFYDPEIKAVSTRQLAKMIGCSLSILLKDLEEIETLYDQELTLKREEGQVYIVIHTDYTYGYFFQSYAHACSEFMILDTLFKRQINTMDEAAEIFYMSRTSFSRAIQRINNFFTDLEIPAQITKSPLKLDMSETVYRTYYPLFLDIYYSVDEWLCKDVTYQEVLDFFLKVSDHSNFIEFYMKNPFIYLRLAINMQRTFEGSLVAKGEWAVSDTKLEHILKNIPEDKRQITIGGRSYTIDKPLLYQLSAGIVDDHIILYPQCLKQAYFPQIAYFNRLKALYQQLKHLSISYQLISITDEQLQLISIIIHNYCFMNRIVREYFSDFNVFSIADYRKMIMDLNDDFVSELEACIYEFIEPFKIQGPSYGQLCFTVLTVWTYLINDLKAGKPRYKALISTENYYFDRAYADYLNGQFCNSIKFYNTDQPWNWVDAQKLDYDLYLISHKIPCDHKESSLIITNLSTKQVVEWVKSKVQLLDEQNKMGELRIGDS